jgi:hypothetical protein
MRPLHDQPQDEGGGGGGGDGWGWERTALNLLPNLAALALYFGITSYGGDGWGESILLFSQQVLVQLPLLRVWGGVVQGTRDAAAGRQVARGLCVQQQISPPCWRPPNQAHHPRRSANPKTGGGGGGGGDGGGGGGGGGGGWGGEQTANDGSMLGEEGDDEKGQRRGTGGARLAAADQGPVSHYRGSRPAAYR